jgi:phosphate transport system substrate-binding protein
LYSRSLAAWVLLCGLAAALLAGCNSESTVVTSETTRTRAIQNKGSDTMVNLALAWAEAYRVVEPEVDIAVTGGGSGTGIAALVNGTVDIANASRSMGADEIADAGARGITAQEHVVAVDAVAVIVNKSNPVSQLTIAQLSDIFSGRVTNWKEVGGDDSAIVLVSRESNSGTHVYFLEEVVRMGDSESTVVFAPQTLLMPSSVGITSEVQRNPRAIGYDGLGYVDMETEKLIAVARDADSPFVLPSVASGADGSYPISRDLYMYSTGAADTAILSYLDWIRGPEGQAIVAELGFVPIPEE